MLKASVKLISRERAIKRVAGPRVLAKMRAVAEEIRDDTRDAVGTPFPPASSPGEYPHRRSGEFQRSIRYATDARERKIILYSTDDPKAIWLEYGTRHMKPRPTFRKAANRFRRKLNQAFKSGVSLRVQ